MAPRSQRSVNISTPRAERIRRRKTRRSFFTFVVAQLLIAGVAFIFVRDYMSDGFTKQALANVLNKVTSVGSDSKTDPAVATAVSPPPALEAVTDQEVAPVQEPAAVIEPDATPPVETAEVEAVDVPAVPQAEVQATPPAVEPEPVAQIEPPAVEPEPEPELQAEVQTASPPVEPEPVPQVEVQATPPPVVPEPAPQAEEQVVAVAPVPDPTPSNVEPAVVCRLLLCRLRQQSSQNVKDRLSAIARPVRSLFTLPQDGS